MSQHVPILHHDQTNGHVPMGPQTYRIIRQTTRRDRLVVDGYAGALLLAFLVLTGLSLLGFIFLVRNVVQLARGLIGW